MKRVQLAMAFRISLAAFALLMCGCKMAGNGEARASDHIRILSVDPGTHLVAGARTKFHVKVAYNLATKRQGVLMVGFNTGRSISDYTMIISAQKIVAQGTGVHEFDVNTTVKDWGASGAFVVYVNLSEYPFASTWMPLANDVRALNVQ